MWPWKRRAPPSPPTPQRNSFFSTDGDVLPRDNSIKRLRRMQEMLALTFQRTIDDLKPVDAAGELIPMTDAHGNAIALDEAYPDLQYVKARNGLGLGGYIPETQFAWYCGQGFIGYQQAALISQNWLVRKACAMPAKDASRNGYELSVNDGTEVDPEVLDYIREEDKKFEVLRNCVEFIDLGRTFGVRVAMFIVDSKDPEYYAKPFNPDGVKPGSYKGISQIDPYWVSPELGGEAAANPAAMDFYEPTWWRIGGRRVHRTHLIIFRNGNLPDILKPAYLYGGIPVPQLIAERVYASERTANEAPMLAMTKRLTVMKCDITQAIANPEQFNAKMGFYTEVQNNFGVKIIGLDDTLEQHDTSLAELDAAIMTQYQLVAAASGVPATKLLGTSPKGFNATGEFEESSYHEELESIQQHDLSPLVNRHHLLLIRSHVVPKFGGDVFHTEVAWKPVDSPTAAEQAEINFKKAQTDDTLVQAGAIDGTDVRERLINDLDSGYNGIAPIVPNGPGDREYQQEMAEQASTSEVDPGENGAE
jgi:phage-related protein (TIGR01555 family)